MTPPAAPLTIACPSQVITSTPFDCTVTIRLPEPSPGAGGELRLTLPPGLFHLANSANVRFDVDSRQLATSLDRDTSTPFTLSLSLIADEAGAGRTRTLSASMSIGTEIDGVEKPREADRSEASATILVAPGEPVILGALESPRTPLTATLWIVIAIVSAVWIVRRRRALRRAPARSGAGASRPDLSTIGVSAIAAIVSGVLLFFCMPACIETVRARTAFVAATCEIVDRGSSGLAPEIDYVPMAIVRYEADGRTRVASGFDVRGTMYGSNDPDARRQFAVGGRYRCWYDPAEPRRVILRQGPSAAAWFALLPVAMLTLVAGALFGAWRD